MLAEASKQKNTTSKYNPIDNQCNYDQKKPPRGVLKKSCSENMQPISGEHSCRGVISIKLLCNFVKITLRHGSSPVNLPHIFRTACYKNTYEELLLCL